MIYKNHNIKKSKNKAMGPKGIYNRHHKLLRGEHPWS